MIHIIVILRVDMPALLDLGTFFIGPADCNHCNRNHKLLRDLCQSRLQVAIFTKQNVVAVAGVAVCWSYEFWLSDLMG